MKRMILQFANADSMLRSHFIVLSFCSLTNSLFVPWVSSCIFFLAFFCLEVVLRSSWPSHPNAILILSYNLVRITHRKLCKYSVYISLSFFLFSCYAIPRRTRTFVLQLPHECVAMNKVKDSYCFETKSNLSQRREINSKFKRCSSSTCASATKA